MARLVDIEDVKNMFRDDTILGKTIREYIDTLPTPMAEVDYDKGLKDAWELRNKISHMDYKLFCEIFGVDVCDVHNKVYTMTPQEALAKLEAYEKEQEQIIKVGDVVSNDGLKSVVVRVVADKVYTLTSLGTTPSYTFEAIKKLKKTGKHIDIQSVLDSIGGGVDG